MEAQEMMTKRSAELFVLYSDHTPFCTMASQFGDHCKCELTKYLDEAQTVLKDAAPPEQPATGNDASEAGALNRVLEIARSITQLHLKVSSGSVLYETIELLIHAFKNYDAMMDDAPEAGTETGASQTVDGKSNTWDWEPEDWVEHYGNQIVSLRAELDAEQKRVELVRERRDYWHDIAEEWVKKFDLSQSDLATVTAERDLAVVAEEKAIGIMNGYHTDFAAEREAHAVTAVALDTTTEERNHALATGLEYASRLETEREHADGLRLALFICADHAHLHERHHKGELLDCELPYCSGEIKVIRAHDTRREKEAERGRTVNEEMRVTLTVKQYNDALAAAEQSGIKRAREAIEKLGIGYIGGKEYVRKEHVQEAIDALTKARETEGGE